MSSEATNNEIIPDYIFPIGHLDDAIAVKISLDLLEKEVTNSTWKFPKGNTNGTAGFKIWFHYDCYLIKVKDF